MAICCNEQWGMGMNIEESGHGGNYGYPEGKNPHLFYPDYECCSDQEIKNWEKAKEDWDKENLEH